MNARVAIVGSGPAGMAAAIAAHHAGTAVTIIDDAPREGGQIYRQGAAELQLPPVGLPTELARKKKLLKAFEQIKDQIDLRFETTAHSLYEGPEVQISTFDQSERLNVDAVVVATGVSEYTVPFPGWTLPGVMYAGAAQSLLKAQGVRAGDKIAISGAGALPIAVAAQLALAGGKIEVLSLVNSPMKALLDPAAVWAGRKIMREGLQYLWQLASRGVFYKSGHAIIRAHGDERLEGVTLAKLNRDGSPDLTTCQDREVDLLLLNHGFTANTELVRMAGAAHRYDAIRGGWLPVADRGGQTSVPGVFVAGDGAGLRGALNAEAEGYIVGAAAAAHAKGQSAPKNQPQERIRAQQERFQSGLRRTLELPAGITSWMDNETTICRCEGVTAGRLKQATSAGHLSLDAIKRNTRCGMGWCGGRTCLKNAALLAETAGATTPPDQMRARPVARPVNLGALANEIKPS
ncbi:FAD/NAD(P)-binding oxidoreductase [Cognatishimia sp. SS12]|uniref:FAD/NAD(P)-dependent oxidoreductase n=1 Tax=Cognatishimia sp. SS12 TaxID=2979465 RepID=UPI00232C3336|nr:FAD/NAD(P)-binding oxidoreductase [Cognatishimia sp. SS12]MDC0738069.1 FAD/NAD(P)-binding oxidoreductase [Cognatishimia sp. SS12]